VLLNQWKVPAAAAVLVAVNGYVLALRLFKQFGNDGHRLARKDMSFVAQRVCQSIERRGEDRLASDIN
jgi:hypothetical protein